MACYIWTNIIMKKTTDIEVTWTNLVPKLYKTEIQW